MKVIFGVNARLYVWEIGISRLAVKSSSDTTETLANEEEFEDAPPIDPHGTNGAHMEISPDSIGAYGKQRFGFGSEVSREVRS